MSIVMKFQTRQEFREWLEKHGQTSEGVWLLFGKKGGPKTLTANEALEEALCYGWIDGQMKSIDEKEYHKYFAQRRKKSKWSEKNKSIVKKLEEQGMMTDYGRAKIEEAKKNGQWDAKKPEPITEEQVEFLSNLLKEYELAHTNFLTMSPSVKKTYTKAYYAAKTDSGREKTILWMVERLEKNLKPM